MLRFFFHSGQTASGFAPVPQWLWVCSSCRGCVSWSLLPQPAGSHPGGLCCCCFVQVHTSLQRSKIFLKFLWSDCNLLKEKRQVVHISKFFFGNKKTLGPDNIFISISTMVWGWFMSLFLNIAHKEV